MTRQAVTTDGAPKPVVPYSQAISVDGFVFCSGQVGLDPATGTLADGIEAQTERVMRNLAAVLDSAGLAFADVVKTTILLTDMNDFAIVNGIYAKFVGDPPPARATFAVVGLPRSASVEIEAIARRATSGGG